MFLPKLIPISDSALKKPTILLLADDIFAPSGIGTMSKEIVYKTVDRFNWVQIAAAIQHKDAGKILDVSQAVQNDTGVADAYVKLYPFNGYGDAKILRHILETENIDAILHFTDPRYWRWLYAMEHEIRSIYKKPIMYYSIWDDLPYPHWNIESYSSCDLLMAINKQTHIIHQEVLKHGDFTPIDMLKEDPKAKKSYKDVLCTYVPHGIDSNKFFPIKEDSTVYEDYSKFVETFHNKNGTDFIVFWNNRNIRRKQPGDVVLAFKMFCDEVVKEYGEEAANKCCLFMHTHPQDPNGTDLIAVKEAICPDYKVLFSVERHPADKLNYLYNIADVTLNIASNEGFGLSNAESMMAGTCVIANVTGGLQDQLGFKDSNGNEFWPSNDVTSNHMKTIEDHGEWSVPVFPSNRSLQGSLETPYIFDDRAQPEDVADAIMQIYRMPREERKRRGELGREWMLKNNMEASNMGNSIADSIKLCIETFIPKPRVELNKVDKRKKITNIGITKK